MPSTYYRYRPLCNISYQSRHVLLILRSLKNQRWNLRLYAISLLLCVCIWVQLFCSPYNPLTPRHGSLLPLIYPFFIGQGYYLYTCSITCLVTWYSNPCPTWHIWQFPWLKVPSQPGTWLITWPGTWPGTWLGTWPGTWPGQGWLGHVAVTMWRWPCGGGRVAVAVWRWPCGGGRVAVT